jgi:hypothetical protein
MQMFQGGQNSAAPNIRHNPTYSLYFKSKNFLELPTQMVEVPFQRT